MKNHLKNFYNAFEAALCAILYSILKAAPVEFYQPIFGSDKPETTRACQDRWTAIAPHLDMRAGSVLDIGCNVGFFTFSAAGKGKMAMGVDADPFYIMACRIIARATGKKDAYFLKGMVTKDFLEKMPSYDTVFNFSVFHHWVKAYGEAEAKMMMQILSGKCSCLFFESGQPDEKGTKWAEKLSFMGDKPDEWIAGFLKDCGFTDVKVIGTFETGLTATKRYLFAAKK